MMPSGIQRREKFTTLPMPGTSTAMSSARLIRKILGACFSQMSMGTCTTASATTAAMTSDSRCRCRKKAGE